MSPAMPGGAFCGLACEGAREGGARAWGATTNGTIASLVRVHGALRQGPPRLTRQGMALSEGDL